MLSIQNPYFFSKYFNIKFYSINIKTDEKLKH